MAPTCVDQTRTVFTLMRMHRSLKRIDSHRLNGANVSKEGAVARNGGGGQSVRITTVDEDAFTRSCHQCGLLIDQLAGYSANDRDEVDSVKQSTLGELVHAINNCIGAADLCEGGQVISPQRREHRQLVVDALKGFADKTRFSFAKQRKMRLQAAVRKRDCGRLASKADLLDISRQIPLISLTSYQDDSQRQDMKFMTAERQQLLVQENAALQEDLCAHSQELELIEHQVVEVNNLQMAFSEHVMSQHELIDSIFSDVHNVNQDVGQANELLRRTIGDNSRHTLIFLILVLAFSLLFLNWYNN